MAKIITVCAALLVMHLALVNATFGLFRSHSSYCCGRLKGTNACDIRPESELHAGNQYEKVHQLFCWGLSQGRKNQACNEFKRNTLCQRDCVEPICWKFNRPCPSNKNDKGQVLVGNFSDKCWVINTGARIARFYNRTASTSGDGKAVPNSICEGLPKNKVYEYPCQKDADATQMEDADSSTPVCGNCHKHSCGGRENKRFKSLQAMLIYNCQNKKANCEVVADSDCD